MRNRLRRGTARITAAVLLAATLLTAPRAMSADAADCWASFYRDAGIAEPGGAIQTFRFAGRTFRVPANYLSGSPPRDALSDQGAVWLRAWLPNLAPITGERRAEASNPRAPYIRITVFGNHRALTGQQLLDVMIKSAQLENRNDERDTLGFRVLRGTNRRDPWNELHLSPSPHHLFVCAADGIYPNPICTAHRTIDAPLRMEVQFLKGALPQYAGMDGWLTRMACCLLDPAESQTQIWPRDCQTG